MNYRRSRNYAVSMLAPICLIACAAPIQSGTEEPQHDDIESASPAAAVAGPEKAFDAETELRQSNKGDVLSDTHIHVSPADIAIKSDRLALNIGGAGGDLIQFGTTQFLDGFEGSTPWTRWEEGQSGDGVTGYDVNQGAALSGQNNSWLKAGNGWASNRIPVNLNGFTNRSNCAAAVSARALGSGGVVGLQIWNPNGWQVIAAAYPYINGNGAGYQQIAISNLNLSGFSGNIYLQAIYSNSSGVQQFVRIDNMVLQCYF